MFDGCEIEPTKIDPTINLKSKPNPKLTGLAEIFNPFQIDGSIHLTYLIK